MTSRIITTQPIEITVYKWSGSWGPFKVRIPCGECTLTVDVVKDCLNKELRGIPIKITVLPWLNHWFRCLCQGGWHAPIVMVNGKVISQGRALNRGKLVEYVSGVYAKIVPLQGNHIFSKPGCPYCQEAKDLLHQFQVEFQDHDVIENTRYMFEMLARVRPHLPSRTPLTVPQIWLDGEYVGGVDALKKRMKI